ncbi:MAG: TonB-dependent receptor [Chitinophagaceae bacterium]|nr:MAG: TonB-dependent receptor [Chitinophagaceae bacterium]
MDKRFNASAFLLLAGLSAGAQAQPADIQLDPVTVTSGFAPVSASRSGRNILVIPGAAFQKLPVSSVDELLRYVPGVEIQARGPMGAQSDIVMRGGTFQQVLVLIDGVRVNDPFSGHFTTYFPIAPAEIERIEVLKGASSALYGSEAVGGVIHIITRSFAARAGSAQKGGSAQVSAGSYGLLNAQAGGVFGNGRSTVGGGLLSNNADGVPQRGIKGYFHAHTASLSASHHFAGGLRLSARASYDERDFAAQNFYTTFASDTSRERVRSSWNQLALAYERGRNRWTLEGGYRHTTDRFLFNSASIANENKSGLWQLLARNEHRFSDAWVLTSGLQYFRRGIHSNDRGNHAESQVAAIGTLQYTSPGGLSITPALRLDWQEQRGAELVPQLALSYRSHGLQLRASGGKTIRDADFTERYNNYNKVLVTSGRIGNPALASERSWAWEAGADYFLTKALKVSGTFFQRYHTGLIDYVPTPYAQMPRRSNLAPGGSYALAMNMASVNITGAELDVQFRHAFAGTRRELSAAAGLTWAGAESPNGAQGFYLSSFAKYLLSGQVAYSTPRIVLGLTGLYKQRAAAQSAPAIKADLSKDYFVLNGKAQFFVLPEKLGVFVQADNLFDRSYSDLLGAPMPGRWWQFGAHFKL